MLSLVTTSLRAFGQAAIAPSQQEAVKGGTDSQDSDIIILDEIIQ